MRRITGHDDSRADRLREVGETLVERIVRRRVQHHVRDRDDGEPHAIDHRRDGSEQIERLAGQLVAEKTVRIDRAQEILEAWNRRATIYYLKKDYGHALSDIREVLRREPRHFGALSGLGLILQDLGDDKQALEVYRRTLDIYPRIQRVPDLVKTLKEKVEGRDI